MMTIRERKITVERKALIATLKANLEKHKADYQEALSEYHAQLLKDLAKAQKLVKKTVNPVDLKNFKLANKFPENHENDYEEIIGMLEQSVEDTIVIDSEAYRAYYMDNWAWKTSFVALKNSYIGSALIN